MNPVVEFLDILLKTSVITGKMSNVVFEMSVVVLQQLDNNLLPSNVVFEVSVVLLQQLDNNLLLFDSFCCDGGLPR